MLQHHIPPFQTVSKYSFLLGYPHFLVSFVSQILNNETMKNVLTTLLLFFLYYAMDNHPNCSLQTMSYPVV